MKLRNALLHFATILSALAQDVSAPPHHWRVFTETDGLPEAACASVTIGAGGSVLVRHAISNTVAVLDGYDVASIPAPGMKHARVHESPGGQLWAVAPAGLEEFRDGQWVLHGVPEIAEHFRAGFTNAIPLCPVRQGRVLFLLSDRLMQFDSDESDDSPTVLLRRAEQTRLGSFTALSLARDGGLWISGTRAVAKIAGPLRSVKPNSTWNELIPPADVPIQNFHAVQEDDTGGLTVLAQSTSLSVPMLARYDAHGWSVRVLNAQNLRFAWRSLGKTWGVTEDALLELSDDRGDTTMNKEMSVRRIADVTIESGGAFWLATSDGLFRHAPAIWETSAAEGATPAAALPPLDANAPQAEWTTHFTARNGDLWLGGAREVAWRHQNSWRLFSSTNQAGPEDVVAFAEAPDGRIWCATPAKIWEFDGRNWLALRGGFDRINGLAGTRDGTLWVATDHGLFRLVRGAWIANGPEDGLPDRVVRAVSEDKLGQIWAHTARGASRFRPAADLDPPRTFLRSNVAAGQTFREGKSAAMSFSGRDKWKCTAVNRLLFSYRLDEREWSPFQDRGDVSFADLPAGKHYFQARAMDRNGNMDPKPARLEFVVALPWYRETRLVFILAIALVIALFFAGVALNRHRQLLRSYAVVEEQVAARTRELELANRELLHSQKMNALGTLAAGIAHDFNNILSIVKGSAQLIEENLDSPQKIRTRLDRIKTVVQQGAGIVEAMLGFSRSSDGPANPSSLNSMVDDTITLLGERFLREVDVRFERGENLPEVCVAREFVQQVLLNFMFNAAESMNERKRVNVATRQVETLPAKMVLWPASAGRYLTVSVEDFGSGISPENLPRVFEPFFTTKALSTRRGTGLGLSMVYELAKKLEAGLAVESIVGRGSTFTLILPVRELSGNSRAQARQPHSTASSP